MPVLLTCKFVNSYVPVHAPYVHSYAYNVQPPCIRSVCFGFGCTLIMRAGIFAFFELDLESCCILCAVIYPPLKNVYLYKFDVCMFNPHIHSCEFKGSISSTQRCILL